MNKPRNEIDIFIEEKVSEAYRPIIEKFRGLIQREFPNLKEEMRGGTKKYYGVPVYRYNKIVITLSPTKKGITFSFSEGKKFEDTYGLLKGAGNKSFNLRLTKLEEYDDAILRYYILQGIEHDEEIKAGLVHEVPKDIEAELKANVELLHLWNKLTPIQRNEWICWVTIVKMPETRKEHIERLIKDILGGKRNPCCWPGCPHRNPNAMKYFK